MKHTFLTLLVGLALASCSEINTDPAPVRATRTVQTATLTYSLSAKPTAATDTALVNPKLEIYTYPVTTNEDGSTTTPNVTGTLLRTITDFSSPQPITLITAPVTVTDGVASPLGLRMVFSSSNRPGRRSGALSQRMSASLLVNGTQRATFTFQGTNFARTFTPANGGPFVSTFSTNIGGYSF
ncbi:hypothetical protein SAMN02745146_2269 [Hymenobacter daecheongensis DSM 21074]|uniref:Uncharacterized protein n=1 Tax=Hymenobacter daecheongensis DSM 21074 TaxID=1121955 RepID=A0A1M6GI22_9BACT|nr:hypothetical protein [Hymenobacter daecheongensis]SHJ09589.1 hypothetical protein SAMN02745146_2269 [Hymenobacter daecheongensis DSM 21074]